MPSHSPGGLGPLCPAISSAFSSSAGITSPVKPLLVPSSPQATRQSIPPLCSRNTLSQDFPHFFISSYTQEMVEGKWTRLRITISNRPGSQATTVLVQPHLGTFVTQSWHTSMACRAGWELCSWHAAITTLTPLYYNHLCWPLIVPVNFSRARTLCSHFSCFK